MGGKIKLQSNKVIKREQVRKTFRLEWNTVKWLHAFLASTFFLYSQMFRPTVTVNEFGNSSFVHLCTFLFSFLWASTFGLDQTSHKSLCSQINPILMCQSKMVGHQVEEVLVKRQKSIRIQKETLCIIQLIPKLHAGKMVLVAVLRTKP